MEKYLTSIKDLVIQAKTNVAEIKDKAEKGEAKSCFLIGMIHLLGINTPIDFKKSSQYFGNPALANDDDVNRLLGFIAECDGNYSLAFKQFAIAADSKGSNVKRPYINRVFEERNNIQSYFKQLGLPTNSLNREITTVLNEYIKGGSKLTESKIKLAYLCDDETSSLEAAQALFDQGDYYTAKRWLQNGKIESNKPLFAAIEYRTSGAKKEATLPKELEVIDIDGYSFMAKMESAPSYAGIKSVCDEYATICKKEWNESISLILENVYKEIKEDELNAERIKQQKEAEQQALLLRQAEEEKELKKKRIGKRITIFCALLLTPFLLASFFAFHTWGDRLFALFILVIIPFIVLRWLLRKVVFFFVK